jgi:hypothetical protein
LEGASRGLRRESAVPHPASVFVDTAPAIGGARHHFVVVLRILSEGEPNLLQIALTAGTTRILTRPGKYWKQNRREYSYYGNHNEQFYERKASCYAPAAG